MMCQLFYSICQTVMRNLRGIYCRAVVHTRNVTARAVSYEPLCLLNVLTFLLMIREDFMNIKKFFKCKMDDIVQEDSKIASYS